MNPARVNQFIDQFRHAFEEGDPGVSAKQVEAQNVSLLQEQSRAIVRGDFAAFLGDPIVVSAREVEADASVRLLVEFDEGYVAKKGVPIADYRQELGAFAEQYQGLEYLRRYA